MWSAPKRFAPDSTMRLTSSSMATSPTAASACPPAFSTSATVSSAALSLMSHTTTRAPSPAKRTAASRPIPIPAPVISAILPSSLMLMLCRRLLSPPHPALSPSGGEGSRSPSPLWGEGRVRGPSLDSLEKSHQLPVGHGLDEGLLLETAVVEVVRHDAFAEGLARQLRPLELVERLAQRLRDLAELRVLVGVAVVEPGRLELLVDAVEARGDGRGEGQVRIGVGARNAVLHAEARPFPAQAEAAGAVVPARGDARGREGPRLVALVGIDGGRVEVGKLTRHRHLPRQPLLEERRPLPPAAREEALLARAVPEGGVEVEGRARGAHVVLRHEGDRAALLPRDLLDAVLVEHVAIGHLERLGVAEVDLLLPPPPLTLRELHRHARRFHRVPNGAHQRLLLGRLEDVIVLEVAGDRRQAVVALGARLVEGLAEEIELELGGGLHREATLAHPLDLPLQHPAR